MLSHISPLKRVIAVVATLGVGTGVFFVGNNVNDPTPKTIIKKITVPSLRTAAPTDLTVTRSIDGSNNNVAHPTWGQAGTNYIRKGSPHYSDGKGGIISGPNVRFISNRIFNDNGQNLFSDRNISQWGWAWGQFIDHDLGLRNETPGEDTPIAFNNNDPLESFTNDPGTIGFTRTPPAPGTGGTTPRQQVNTLTSFIDGSQVYGSNLARLNWEKQGAKLFLPNNFLPRADARGDVAAAPPMDLMGRLTGQSANARVAGDVRANENIALTAITTLFAREHNRIVDLLPERLSDTQKFAFARRIVGAEIEYITYTEWLPALGVTLPTYKGYDPNVNPGLSNEFAATGFRAHSMVHGQFDVPFQDGDYTDQQLIDFSNEGVGIGNENGEKALNIPLSVAFGNPDLLQQVGIGKLLESLSAERQYKNDEQIDNTLRSVLFETPKPGTTDPSACQEPVVQPGCFSNVQDLGAIDILRARDHGIGSYNDLRKAFGLTAVTSFTQITGETTDVLPAGQTINDPHILDFTKLSDANGNPVKPDDKLEKVVDGTRSSTLAARLKAIYGTVDKVDAFVGMVSEKHVPGTEFGETQLAIWKDQFTRARDGDQFFYLNDPALKGLDAFLGITFRNGLSDIINMNVGVTVPRNPFLAVG